MIVALTGSDTVIIGGQIITDFATGVVGEIKFDSDIVQVTRGKNGNTVYALNNQGFQSTLDLRIIMGGANDQFLNAQMALMKQNFAAYPLLLASFVKNVGDGKGNIKRIEYVMSGGVPKKQPGAKSVAEGDPTQSLVEWNFEFGNNDRTIG